MAEETRFVIRTRYVFLLALAIGGLICLLSITFHRWLGPLMIIPMGLIASDVGKAAFGSDRPGRIRLVLVASGANLALSIVWVLGLSTTFWWALAAWLVFELELCAYALPLWRRILRTPIAFRRKVLGKQD